MLSSQVCVNGHHLKLVVFLIFISLSNGCRRIGSENNKIPSDIGNLTELLDAACSVAACDFSRGNLCQYQTSGPLAFPELKQSVSGQNAEYVAAGLQGKPVATVRLDTTTVPYYAEIIDSKEIDDDRDLLEEVLAESQQSAVINEEFRRNLADSASLLSPEDRDELARLLIKDLLNDEAAEENGGIIQQQSTVRQRRNKRQLSELLAGITGRTSSPVVTDTGTAAEVPKNGEHGFGFDTMLQFERELLGIQDRLPEEEIRGGLDSLLEQFVPNNNQQPSTTGGLESILDRFVPNNNAQPSVSGNNLIGDITNSILKPQVNPTVPGISRGKNVLENFIGELTQGVQGFSETDRKDAETEIQRLTLSGRASEATFMNALIQRISDNMGTQMSFSIVDAFAMGPQLGVTSLPINSTNLAFAYLNNGQWADLRVPGIRLNKMLTVSVTYYLSQPHMRIRICCDSLLSCPSLTPKDGRAAVEEWVTLAGVCPEANQLIVMCENMINDRYFPGFCALASIDVYGNFNGKSCLESSK